MTLIDAEALYKHFAELEEEARNKYISTTNEIEKSWWSIVLTERTAYKYDVADAPVIEPRRGKWILDRSGAYCCSKCMEPCAGYVMMRPRDRFCKMCGARMEEVTNESQ